MIACGLLCTYTYISRNLCRTLTEVLLAVQPIINQGQIVYSMCSTVTDYIWEGDD